jgi:hypothetical protein
MPPGTGREAGVLRDDRDPENGSGRADGGELYRGPVAFDRGSFKIDPRLADSSSRGRIRCPNCNWQPERSSLWTCMPAGAPEFFRGGCGHSWNTFDTGGRCPGCRHQWRFTMCLKCQTWSPHDDWYEKAGKGRSKR